MRKIVAIVILITQVLGSIPAQAVESSNDIPALEQEVAELESPEEIFLEEYAQELKRKEGKAHETINAIKEEVAKYQQRPMPFTVSEFRGEGTESSPYLIDNLAELKYFAERVNAGNKFGDRYFKVTNDIDLYEEIVGVVVPWEPIRGFEGSFDGNNHIISNLHINSAEPFQGLFGLVFNATISNVNVEISHMEVSGEYAGAIIGSAKNTDILNCFARGEMRAIGGKTGGLVGAAIESRIFNSRFSGTIKMLTDFGGGAEVVGGIVGHFSDGRIANCSTTGEVAGYEDVGGIVGMLIHTVPNENRIFEYYIESNFNKAHIIAIRGAGGIIGNLQNGGDFRLRVNIWSNANVGNVEANAIVGGIIGSVQGNISVSTCYNMGDIKARNGSVAGGIIGMLNYENNKVAMDGVSRCYNAGAVEATNSMMRGGIAGYTGTPIFNSHILQNGNVGVGMVASGITTNIRTLTHEQLRDLGGSLAIPYLLDEDNINGGYPILNSINYHTDEVVGEDEFMYASGHVTDYKAKYYYQDGYFMQDATKYNPSLATMSLNLAMSAFASNEATYENQNKNVKKLLEDTGFTNIAYNKSYTSKPERDSIGVIVGNKKIIEEGQEYTLLAVALRGAGYEAEWAGNFLLGDEDEHQGFGIAKDATLAFLDAYVNNEENGVSEHVKIWITGYSRASAVMNLTAGTIIQRKKVGHNTAIEQQNLYAYGFEVPMGTLLKYAKDEEGQPKVQFSSIHNIVNPSDIVTKVAPQVFEFSRYGIDYQIPTKETEANYLAMKPTMLKHYAELDSTGKYIVDDFRVKRFGGWSIVVDPSDRRSQNRFLEESVDRLAEDVFLSRSVFAIVYQDIIRDIMGSLYEQDAVTLNHFYDIFGDRVSTFLKDEAIIASLAGGNIVLYADARTILQPSIETMIKESLAEAGITTISDEVVDKMVWTVSSILTRFVLTDTNATLTLVDNLQTIAEAHHPELCLAWMQAMDLNYTPASELASFSESNGSYRAVVVNCPVDVEVYDEANKLVASIVENVPQQVSESSIITSMNEDGEKLVYLPATNSYNIKLIATDDGDMTFTVNEFSGGVQDINGIVSYYDVLLEKDGVLTAEIPAYSEANLKSGSVHGLSGNYSLFDKEGSKLEQTISLSGGAAREARYRIDVYSEDADKGLAMGRGTRNIGSFAQATAYPEDGYEFAGWYVDDVEISDEVEYRFRAEKDIELIAKFVKTDEVISINKEALHNKVKEIEEQGLVKDAYTDDTWTALSETMQQAKDILADGEATQKEIDDVLLELVQVLGALEAKPELADKADLRAKFEEVSKLIEAEYMEDTWAALQSTLSKANIIDKKVDASQKEVDDILLELEQVIEDLVKKPNVADKTELRAKFEEVAKLIEADYTETTWANLQDVIAKAKVIEGKADVSQKEIDDILEALNQTVNNLEKADKKDSNHSPDSNSETEKEAGAKTGDVNYATNLLIGMFLSLVIITTYLAERKKNTNKK